MYRILTAWVLLAEGVNCRCREDKFGLEELVDHLSKIACHGIVRLVAYGPFGSSA